MNRTIAATLLLLAGCQASLPRWCAVGNSQEDAAALAGQHAAEALEARFGGVVADPAAEARMGRVALPLCRACGMSLATAQFHVLDSTDLNALSLPGPRIYITRTLYERLDDDTLLAAVIAHELAHVCAHDHFKPRGGDARDALQREIDADAGAVQTLRAAGIAPDSMRSVLVVVQSALPPDWAQERMTALDTACAPPARTASASDF
ncbi:MAG TPA: M48 family metallopeptidase [Phycisphaerae bacterium]|nr:M48 family metallopeptidase [Phycisphaerae bacterium]